MFWKPFNNWWCLLLHSRGAFPSLVVLRKRWSSCPFCAAARRLIWNGVVVLGTEYGWGGWKRRASLVSGLETAETVDEADAEEEEDEDEEEEDGGGRGIDGSVCWTGHGMRMSYWSSSTVWISATSTTSEPRAIATSQALWMSESTKLSASSDNNCTTSDSNTSVGEISFASCSNEVNLNN